MKKLLKTINKKSGSRHIHLVLGCSKHANKLYQVLSAMAAHQLSCPRVIHRKLSSSARWYVLRIPTHYMEAHIFADCLLRIRRTQCPKFGEEYLHLPAIVDAAESSPTAAKQAAATIRRYLSKEHNQRGFAQRNAIMLTRILTDNPAHAFTQYFDAKFVSTVKELLREGKDTGVQQILRETLDYFEVEKLPGNDTLNPLIEMWRKEKGNETPCAIR